jgi:hypothetical protein
MVTCVPVGQGEEADRQAQGLTAALPMAQPGHGQVGSVVQHQEPRAATAAGNFPRAG